MLVLEKRGEQRTTESLCLGNSIFALGTTEDKAQTIVLPSSFFSSLLPPF